MLVHYFGYIAGTIDQVASALDRSSGEMSAWARVAYRRGEDLRTAINPGMGLPAKEVELRVGEPVRRSGLVIMPIVWEATGAGALFPTMNADLVLEPVGDRLVQVTLRGSYQPPMKAMGRLIDKALMHRLAEASTKSFLDQLCAAIDEAIPAPGSEGEDDVDGGAFAGPGPDDQLASGLLGPAPQAGQT